MKRETKYFRHGGHVVAVTWVDGEARVLQGEELKKQARRYARLPKPLRKLVPAS